MSETVRADAITSRTLATDSQATPVTRTYRDARFVSTSAGFDAFAQVFAQMSAPAPGRPPATGRPTATEPAEKPASADESDASDDEPVASERADALPSIEAIVEVPAQSLPLCVATPAPSADATNEADVSRDAATIVEPTASDSEPDPSTHAANLLAADAASGAGDAGSTQATASEAEQTEATASAGPVEPTTLNAQAAPADASTQRTRPDAPADSPAASPTGDEPPTSAPPDDLALAANEVSAEATSFPSTAASPDGDSNGSSRERKQRRGGRHDVEPTPEPSRTGSRAAPDAATPPVAANPDAVSSALVEANAAPESASSPPAIERTAAGVPAVAAAAAAARQDGRNPTRSAGPEPAPSISAAGASPAPGTSATAKSTPSQSSAGDAVTRAKLVQRVSKAFHHLGADGGTVRLRLAPAELGSVRVEIQVQGRSVRARVVAETEAASGMLREHLAELRGRLESQGMQVERFEIETDEHAFSRPDDSGRNHSQHDHHQAPSHAQHWLAPTLTAEPTVSRPVSPTVVASAAASGVDVRL